MTSRYLQKIVNFMFFLGVALGIHCLLGQATNDLSTVEQRLVQDALKNINQTLAQKKGTLERISCCYKLADNQPQSAAIKTFYVDYRKKPDYKEYSFKKTSASSPDQVIEIIFKSYEKNKLSIISKNPKKNNKRCGCKVVEIS